MRKLLLGTTAFAAAATMTANVAVADVAISGSYEFPYKSQSSIITALDGTTFATDSEVVLSFTNKTDSGLTVGMVTEIESDDADSAINEGSMSISGGFGKLVLGGNDGAANNYSTIALSLIQEEMMDVGNSASINMKNTEVAGSDATKVSYHLPAMGGLTAGASFTNASAAGNADTTEFGFKYAMDAGGAAITIGGGTSTLENSTQDVDAQNLGITVVSGDISVGLSQGSYEGSSIDENSTSAAVSFKVSDVMTIGAHTTEVEDDSTSEELQVTGAELAYTIAPGLSAVINVEDYDYKVGTYSGNNADSGTSSKLTIKASF
jgi:hypothetical protein